VTDRPSITLPLCVLGAGIVHALCIAVLLPMLITVPAPAEPDAKSTTVSIVVPPPSPAAVPQAPVQIARAGDVSPLVTGSLAGPAATKARLIAALPREDLPAARSGASVVAETSAWPPPPLLASIEPASIAPVPSQEEIEAAAGAAGAEPVTTTEEEEKPRKATRVEQHPSPPTPAPRKASAPAPKPTAVQAKPRTRVPARAAAPTTRQPAASAQRRVTAAPQRQPQARTRPTGTFGLGLFFQTPQPRQQAVKR
jgi:hypothetical protein